MPVSRASTDVPPPTAHTPRPAASSSGRPAWQRQPLFRLFASVKLAVVLLIVLIAASIAGTLYETTFDAKVARAYIYNAWWFNGWLTLVCLNLAAAAFSRWPWKRHHTGFLITHLGIITLLVGAMIGRRWGIEGTMTLFKGQPPSNQLMVDQRVLRLQEGTAGEIRQYPVEIIGRRPTPAKPWTLGQTASGWDIRLVDYAPALDALFEPKAAPSGVGGQPALRVRLTSRRLNQSMEQWILAGDADHGAIDLGLATVQARAGVAPELATASAAPASAASAPAPTLAGDTVEERIVAFANRADAQIGGGSTGSTPTGAKVRLTVDPATGKKEVFVDWRGATWSFDADRDRGQEQDLSGSGLSAVVENYWPDFVMRGGQPASASGQPNNPAVMVRLHGKLPAASDAGADAAAFGGPGPKTPVPPAGKQGLGVPGIGSAADNQALVYCDERGGLTYTLKSSALPAPLRGTLLPGQAVNTGWADWQLAVEQTLLAAFAQTHFAPSKVPGATTDDKSATSGDPGVVNGGGPAAGPAQGSPVEGLRVRLSKGGENREEWVPTGWAITLPTSPQPTRLAYDFQIEPLPIGLQLEGFEVTFNEGTDNPANFKSNLKVTDVEGATGAGSCSMNHPFNFPGHWWNTFSGLTFKMSQASWNPEDLNQSVVQILRDPGWLLKWIGSLLVCVGIFTMFYLRPVRSTPARPSRPA